MSPVPPISIACVGSRQTPVDVLVWLKDKGEAIVRAGHHIVSGNAPGADQAWAAGGNKIDPAQVTLCLPWSGFEAASVNARNMTRVLASPMTAGERHYYNLAASLHPAWENMPPGAQRLHARNVMIVESARVVFGYVGPGGGTAMAFRIARHLQVPCHDVSDPKVRVKFDELLERAVRR